MIQVKDIDVLRALLHVSYDPMLMDIIAWIEDKFLKAILTDGYRPDDKGVHGTIPCRGIDLRDTYGDPKYVETEVNRRWIYDPARLHKNCAVYHDTGKGWHLHIQTHPNTRKREVQV